MQFKAAIFDLDGTLADTVPLTVMSIKKAVKDYTGIEYSDERILKEFGPVDTEIARAFVGEELLPEVSERYVKYFKEDYEKMVKPIAGVKELIEFIGSKGIKLGLFTGRGLRVSLLILEKLGIKDYFEVIVTGDSTKNPKPNPEGILMALDKLNVKPCDGIYTGDFDVDVLASKAAGVTSVLALWSTTKDEELSKLCPDKSFEKTDEFIRWLEEK